MVRAVDQGAIGRATEDVIGGSGKERWIVLAVEQGAIEGAMDDASNGSGSNRRSDGCCKRWIREQ